MNIRSCTILSSKFLNDFSKLWEKTETIDLTSVLLSYWANLGDQEGFQVYTQNRYFEKSEKEYLVDLCWCFEDENYIEYWMELALESELSDYSHEGIMNDFRKLVDIKAHTKVGIFYPPKSRVQDTIEEIANTVAFSGIKIPDERYLLIIFVDHGLREDPQRRVEVSTYEVDSRGEVRKLGEVRVD